MKIKILNSQNLNETKEVNLAVSTNNIQGECLIGRSPSSGLVLDSPDVSRLHGKFLFQNGNYYFCDLGSRNGSIVNGRLAEVNHNYLLEPGNVVRIGEFVLILEEIIEFPESPATVIGGIDATVISNWRSLAVEAPEKVNSQADAVPELMSQAPEAIISEPMQVAVESEALKQDESEQLQVAAAESEASKHEESEQLQVVAESEASKHEESEQLQVAAAESEASKHDESEQLQVAAQETLKQDESEQLQVVAQEALKQDESEQLQVAAAESEASKHEESEQLQVVAESEASKHEESEQLQVAAQEALKHDESEQLQVVAQEALKQDESEQLQVAAESEFPAVEAVTSESMNALNVTQSIFEVESTYIQIPESTQVLEEVAGVEEITYIQIPESTPILEEVAGVEEITYIQNSELNQDSNVKQEVEFSATSVAEPEEENYQLDEAEATFIQNAEVSTSMSEFIEADRLPEADKIQSIESLNEVEVIEQVHPALVEMDESEVIPRQEEVEQAPETVSDAPKITSQKYIALMAHDSKKSDLVQLISERQEFFSQCLTIATPAISETLSQQAGIAVSQQTPTVPIGGYQAIASLVGSGDILAVIFLRDVLLVSPGQANEEAFLRLCSINQVLFASNVPTAKAIVYYLGSKERF